MSAEAEIEYLRTLIGEDCHIEDVMPLCAGALAAVPVQVAAIDRYRAALLEILDATDPGDVRSTEGQEAWDRINPARVIARTALER